jgi:hypothetical protein
VEGLIWLFTTTTCIFKMTGFYKVKASLNKPDNSLLDIRRLEYLRSRQAFIVQSCTKLPRVSRRRLSKGSHQKSFDDLLAEIEQVDLTPLRDKLDNSGKRFHTRLQVLNVQSGAFAAESRISKLVRWRSKSFTKVEGVVSKKEVKSLVSKWRRDIKALL